MDRADFSTGTTHETLELKGLFRVGDYFARMSHERLTSGTLQGSKLWNRASGNTERRDAHQPKHFPRRARAQFKRFCCWVERCFHAGHSSMPPLLLHGAANAHLQAHFSRTWKELLFSFSPSRSVLQTLSYSTQRKTSPQLCFVTKGWLGHDLQERVYSYKFQVRAGTSAAQS